MKAWFPNSIVACGLVLRSVLSVTAQQTESSSVRSSPQSPFAGTNAFHDEWVGISDATNQWAVTIRASGDWNEIQRLELPETRERAEKGQPVAQLRLGCAYYAGKGVERDYSEAVKWLTKAAGSNFAPAQFLLGEAYLKGTGAQ